MHGSLLKKLLRDPIAASRARSLLAYLFDMSRRSLCGSLHSGRSLRFLQKTACDLQFDADRKLAHSTQV